ncbi:MAG: TonB-dependent receptor [Bacteroidota bacterium]
MNVKLRKFVIGMSKIAIYMAVCCYSLSMAMSTPSSGQRKYLKEIDFQVRQETSSLLEILAFLEADSDFTFAYTRKDLEGKSVSLDRGTWTLDDLLSAISVQAQVSFRRVNETISVKIARRNNPLPDVQEDITSLQLSVSGSVTDENGDALPGATVLEKGTSNGTITDVNGDYRLNVSTNDAYLTVSFVGYESLDVPVNGRSSLDISLQPDVSALEEVVVVGYGTQRKSDLTGSIASVKEEELKRIVMTSFDQGLQGQAAGVQVTQTSAAPGGGVSINIRGNSSINAGNDPLYVIDGFPLIPDAAGATPTGDISGNGVAYTGQNPNPLSTINPSDIVSIEVLKDASATAIYGARGANGVVLITTRRGEQGAASVNLEMYHGVQWAASEIDFLNAAQHGQILNDLADAEGEERPFDNPASLGQGTDWVDQIVGPAAISNYYLSVSGGSEKTRYALTGSYFNQEGIVRNSGFERGTFRMNLDSDLNSKLKVGTNWTLALSSNDIVLTNGPGVSGDRTSAFAWAQRLSPTLPIRDANGDFVLSDVGDTRVIGNPVAMTEPNVVDEVVTTRFLGTVFAEYQILDDLSFRTNLGGDFITAKRNFFYPATHIRAFNSGRAGVGQNTTYNWLFENTLTYDKSFNSDHQLNVLLGVTAQEERLERVRAGSSSFGFERLGFNNLAVGEVPDTPISGAREWSLLSYIARINYAWKGKYLLTLTGRADGSSRFGSNNRYGYFPSGSVGWRLSDEPFVQDLAFFDDLKLRVSYGLTGNQEIPVNLAFTQMTASKVPLDATGSLGVTGLRPTAIGNPDLQWESTSQFDIGLDMAFWGSRVSVTADYYVKNTRDMLLLVDLPGPSGFGGAFRNIGEVENRGFELSLNAILVDSDLKWRLSGNLSVNRNEVLDLGEDNEIFVSVPNFFQSDNEFVIREGQPIGSFFGAYFGGIYESQDQIDAMGIQPDAQPGDRIYLDVSGPDGVPDGIYSPEFDHGIIGNPFPDFIYGFSNDFGYKGFELNLFFNGSVGNEIINFNRAAWEGGNAQNNKITSYLNRWTPENTQTDIARLQAGPEIVNTRLIEDASFLRLRTVTLAYNLPMTNVKAVQSAKIYVTGQNLLTFTDYSGYDPEVNFTGSGGNVRGFDADGYPASKMFLVGLNVGF